jgi:hypothetical protein
VGIKKIWGCIVLLAWALVFMPGPVQAAPDNKAWGTAVSVVKLDGSVVDLDSSGAITVGEFAYLQITFTDAGQNLMAELNPGRSLAEISVSGGDADVTSKFTPELESGALRLQLISALEEGTSYHINIPAGLFTDLTQTTANEQLICTFVTASSVILTGLEPISLNAADIGKEQSFFCLKGSNFPDTIQKIVLTPVAGNCLDLPAFDITILKQDIVIQDAATLKVLLTEDNAVALGKEEACGSYRVDVYYGDAPNLQQASAVAEITLQVISRGVPAIKSYYPAAGLEYDEKALRPQSINGTIRYFLSVQFNDPDGTLIFNQAGNALERLKTSVVYAAGGSQISMIDSDFINWIDNISEVSERSRAIETYLYNTPSATLYIPIKLLRPQTTYTVVLNEGIVKFSGGKGNAPTSWSFSTMPVPAPMSISPGSVPEDYRSGTFIEITGSFFAHDGVRVKFNDRYADRVEKTTVNGQTRLKAILPRSRRLEPGVYNVTVINDIHHQQTLYSAFSVVQQSDLAAAQEGQRNIREGKLGDVVEKVTTSETVLQLDTDYRDINYLKIDLDKLMGDKVLTRTISFPGRRGERINELETLSRWADITLYGVTLDSAQKRDEISVRLGRVDTARSAWLTGKLRGKSRVSDYIEVGGSNFRVDLVKIKLPFSRSEGNNLKVLRYDENLRNFMEVPFTVDRLEGTVSLYSINRGIFVVVE